MGLEERCARTLELSPEAGWLSGKGMGLGLAPLDGDPVCTDVRFPLDMHSILSQRKA